MSDLVKCILRIVVASTMFAATSVVAQPAATSDKETYRMQEPLDFDRVGAEAGLPQSEVQAIVQDDLGFVWFGTQDGLARYDGAQKMHVFRPSPTDAASISTGYVTALTIDKSGQLWVGTDTKGVNIYDPKTDHFTHYAHDKAPNSLSSEGVNAVLRDHKDRMWFAMSGGGLNRFDEAKHGFVDYQSDPLDTSITTIANDASNNLWLGTTEEGVIRWNPDDGKSTRYLNGPQGLNNVAVNTILVSAKGTIYVGTEGEGLFIIDVKTGAVDQRRHDPTNPETLSHDHISTLFEDRDHAIWIGTHNGLDRLAADGKLTTFQHDAANPTSIVYPWVTSIYQDRGGVIWIGEKSGGACKFSPQRPSFGHYRMRSDTANSFFEDSDGTLWIGTYHGGLYHYDFANKKVTTYHTLGTPNTEGAVLLDLAWISAVHRDKRGLIWIATLELGLIAFDPETESHKQYRADPKNPNALPNDTIWDIWEDPKGDLWLATWGGGLVRYDTKANKFTSLTMDDSTGLSSNHLYRIYPDPKAANMLWIGTAKGGVVKFDTVARTGVTFAHKPEDPSSIASDDILAIYRDGAGSVWLGTYGGGLDRLDPNTGKAEHFTTVNSKLSSDVIFGILPDDSGALWLSTNGGGLVQFDPSKKTFFAYDASDGVQNNEFGQGSFMRDASGKLFFGGVGGFNMFVGSAIKRNAYPPPVVFTGLRALNQDVALALPIWTLPSLKMSYSDSFEVQFAALSFAAPQKNRYAYKLEGFDDKWIETDRSFATYTKLEGGNYRFRVRAANEHGVWNESGVAIKIGVSPPWWRTWPAFIVYVLIIIGIALLLFRLQRQRLSRAEREGRLQVIERDLELTGAVQSGFLPEFNEINTNRVNLYGFYRAADACSGDWWWHQMLPNGKHIVMVGDVTGHGPGPAMVTAAVATAFRVLINNGLSDIKHALVLLNEVVLSVAKNKYHMTMAAFEIDEATGVWQFHSAGSPPILSIGSTGKHRVHFSAGTPLGTESGSFETGLVEGRFEPTDRMLLYTDGIPEITLQNGNVLGMRRFAQMFERTKSQTLKQAASSIVEQADATQPNRAQQADDWTFTIVEWNG